ncbi:hypothetical protein ACF0H5_006057 [Mactra antiquata]
MGHNVSKQNNTNTQCTSGISRAELDARYSSIIKCSSLDAHKRLDDGSSLNRGSVFDWKHSSFDKGSALANRSSKLGREMAMARKSLFQWQHTALDDKRYGLDRQRGLDRGTGLDKRHSALYWNHSGLNQGSTLDNCRR